MRPSNLNPYFLNLLFLIYSIILGTQPAMADVVLPSINDKYIEIHEVNPTRDAGFVVGDVLERTITLTVKKPYELVKESIPIVGYEHRYQGQISGIELVKISIEEKKNSDSVTHVLHLSYQVFTTGKLAKPAALRAEIVKMRNTEKKELLQYRIPSFAFRISPLSVFGAIKLKEELSPLTPPLLIDSSNQKLHVKVLSSLLGLSLLGLLYIFGMHAWLPRMGAPFAKAYRDIRKAPDTTEGLKQAVGRMHEALNKTAGTTLFGNNIESFLKTKPTFAPVKQDIEKFFSLSRQVFFEADGSSNLGENSSKAWLLKFCRHMRDCERGLRPETSR
ncbi:hypothetical protein [Methylotenera sp.]|uniref:hypothetical protein n=2 Tax=Methylotenera sp. TaxID=2051956 RepID=UPI0027260E89|nr:hypothetical protein [Methylotenera sp.]MDO9392997.1 hypothetical protein [Methylotenera sp.]MDP1522762.1 hypothetical protein [Methylotenera sp.]MDP2070162.1 hypothetical protein [Methylotenera sp.]MDP2230973.1 hypothetical protein [Methylotenera sp.]MDP3006532.1 hypothetical protein [Methylotenera sp.]